MNALLNKLLTASVLIKIVNAISGTGIMLSVFIDPISRNKFLTAINAITFLITSIINAFNDNNEINNSSGSSNLHIVGME